MTEKLTLVRPIVLPPQAEREAKSLMSPEQVNKIKKAKFIMALPDRERDLLVSQINAAYVARMLEGISGLAFGAALLNIQEITKKSRAFTKALRLVGGVSGKTARRYMEGYQNASVLPEAVVKAMILKGMTITPTPGKPLGKYTQAVRYLAPPKNDDPDRAKKYVEQIEEYTKERRSRQTKARIKKGKAEVSIGDPEQLLESSFRTVYSAANRLPHNAKAKRRFLDSLVGMLMTHFGVQSQQQFSPEAIPQDFIPQKRGRPVLVENPAPTPEKGKEASTAS